MVHPSFWDVQIPHPHHPHLRPHRHLRPCLSLPLALCWTLHPPHPPSLLSVLPLIFLVGPKFLASRDDFPNALCITNDPK